MPKELKLTSTKGGNFHPIDFKDFVIRHLTEVGEDYQANIHRAYKEQLKILAEQIRTPEVLSSIHLYIIQPEF